MILKKLFTLTLVMSTTWNSFSQTIDFTEHIISTNALEAFSVFAADVDGDNDMDVLSASYNDNKIAWYENIDGLGNFGPQNIITSNADGALCVYATDLDGDGDIDVLSASFNDDKIAWYENADGLGTFGPQRIISDNLVKPSTVYAVDIDLDGDMDVLSASTQNNKVVWFRNLDGQGNFGLEISISENITEPWTVYASDLDGDDDMDVLSGSRYNGKVEWYKNFHPKDSIRVVGQISTSSYGVNQIITGDMDGDNDMDVLSANLNAGDITWWENTDGQGNFLYHWIPYYVGGPWSLSTGDIDLDGDLDIIFVAQNDNKIAWFENQDGLGTFHIEQQIISTNSIGASSVYASDINGDGSIDVLSASRYDNKIAWYENLKTLNINEKTQPYFIVSPNPSFDVLYFNSKYPIVKVEILSEVGQLITSEPYQNQVDISTLSQGLYFIKIIDVYGNTGVEKVIKY